MKLYVERKWPKATYTIGRLFVDDKYFCNTLEDKDRGLFQTDSLEQIKSLKVYGETAIPQGTYEISLSILSPKYGAIEWYNEVCGGKMPRLLNVPGFEGVLIHPGNTPLDTNGCILVGKNTKVGQVLESKATFKKLYKLMEKAYKAGEKITIEIA